jgi:protein-S-isoprenylcysteine O-methyltransferase Ste14
MGGQIVSVIAGAARALLEVYLHVFYHRRVREGNAEKLSRYTMLAAFAFAGFGACLLTPQSAAGLRLPFTPVRWAGALLILVSVALRATSVAQLGGYYAAAFGERYRAWARRTRRLIPCRL